MNIVFNRLLFFITSFFVFVILSPTYSYAQQPDLQMPTVSACFEEAGSSNFRLRSTFTERNAGNAAAAAHRSKYFTGTESASDVPAECRGSEAFQTTTNDVPALNPNDSSTTNKQEDFSQVCINAKFLSSFGHADPLNTVSESNESNNSGNDNNISPCNSVDFQALSIAQNGACAFSYYFDSDPPIGPYSYYYETRIPVTISVRNNGSQASGMFWGRADVSNPQLPASTFYDGDVGPISSDSDLGEYFLDLTNISAGGTVQYARTIRVGRVAGGPYITSGNMSFTADLNDAFSETNEGNNSVSGTFNCSGDPCPPGRTYNIETGKCEIDIGISPTPIPTEPPASNWAFPAQTFRGSAPNPTPQDGVTLELWYSDEQNTSSPEPQGPVGTISCTSSLVGGSYWNKYTHAKCTPPNLTDCEQDRGYCLLGTPSVTGWDHHFYFIRVVSTLGAPYVATNAECRWASGNWNDPIKSPPYTSRPSTGAPPCVPVSINGETMIRIGTTPWGYGIPAGASRGYYSGNVLYVVTGTPTPTPTVTPTPTTISAPWFQVQGGNAYANGNISSLVPTGDAFNTKVTNTASEGTSYFGGTMSIGSSDPIRNANSSSFPIAELVDYQTLYSRFGISASTPTVSGSDITKSGISGQGSTGNTAVYFRDGNLTLSGDWSNFTGNVVIFVNGNLNINTNVTVDQGHFLGFVVSGNITIDPTVIQVQGFYFTDNNASTGVSDNQLTLSGTFVVRGNVSLERDLDDDSLPAELFEYRPDFAFTAPDELRRPYRSWEEVAP